MLTAINNALVINKKRVKYRNLLKYLLLEQFLSKHFCRFHDLITFND